MRYKHPFSPVIFDDSEFLILGTFPSIKSFENDFYYSHPKNQFWKILFTVFDEYAIDKNDKINFLKKHKIALWDIVESCERKNSSDANLKNIKVHDLKELKERYKKIKTIAFTGKKALYFYEKYHIELDDINICYLPSPSPAYAVMGISEKTEIYKKCLLDLR